MNQREPSNRIIITEEDIAPMVPEAQPTGLRDRANQAGQQLANGAKRAWESDARRQVTDKVQSGVATVASKGSQLVRDKVAETAERQARATAEAVQTRLQETDWKKEAQQGAVRGLKWLSQRLAQLADRFTPKEKSPTDINR